MKNFTRKDTLLDPIRNLVYGRLLPISSPKKMIQCLNKSIRNIVFEKNPKQGKKAQLKRRNNIFHLNRKGNKILGIGEDDTIVQIIKSQIEKAVTVDKVETKEPSTTSKIASVDLILK